MTFLEILGAFALFFGLLGLVLWYAGVLEVSLETDNDGEA